MQGGLGLPSANIISRRPEDGRVRTKYKSLCRRRFWACRTSRRSRRRQPHHGARNKIAQAHATREESEDFAKGAQVWSRADLEKRAPGIDWGALLNAAQLGSAGKFEAYHANAIPKLAALVGSQPLDAWKDWLEFHTLNQRSNVLPRRSATPASP